MSTIYNSCIYNETIQHVGISKIQFSEQNICNRYAVKYLINHPHKIDQSYDAIYSFSMNDDDLAVQYLIGNPYLIQYDEFSLNENDMAVYHLIENPHKIDWRWFSANYNSTARQYYRDNK